LLELSLATEPLDLGSQYQAEVQQLGHVGQAAPLARVLPGLISRWIRPMAWASRSPPCYDHRRGRRRAATSWPLRCTTVAGSTSPMAVPPSTLPLGQADYIASIPRSRETSAPN
jgi:hypothetical protein